MKNVGEGIALGLVITALILGAQWLIKWFKGEDKKEPENLHNVSDDDLKWVSSSNLALLALADLLFERGENIALADELRRRGSAERKPQEKPK